MSEPISVCELIGCEYFRDGACRNLLTETIPCPDRKGVADRLVSALENIKLRFDSVDDGKGFPNRGGLSWAMWSDAKQALSQIEGETP